MNDHDWIYACCSADLVVTVEELPERVCKWDLSMRTERRVGRSIEYQWVVAVEEQTQRFLIGATVGQVIGRIRRNPEDEKRVVFLWDGENRVSDDNIFVRTVPRRQVAHFRVTDHTYYFKFPDGKIQSYELERDFTVLGFKQSLFYVRDSKRSQLTSKKTAEPAIADLIEIRWDPGVLHDRRKFSDTLANHPPSAERPFYVGLLDPKVNITLPGFRSSIPFKWDETVMAFSFRVANQMQYDFQLAIEDPKDPGKLMLTIGVPKEALKATESSRSLYQFATVRYHHYRRFRVGTSIREVKAILSRDEGVRNDLGREGPIAVMKLGKVMASNEALDKENREFELQVLEQKQYHFVDGNGRISEHSLRLDARSDQSHILGTVAGEVGKHILRMDGVTLAELVHTTAEHRILVDPIFKTYRFEIGTSRESRQLDPTETFQSLTRSLRAGDPDKICFATSDSRCPAEMSIAIVNPANPIKVIEPVKILGRFFKRSATIGEVRTELAGRLPLRVLFKVGDRVLLNSASLLEVEEVRYEEISQFSGKDNTIQPFKFTFHISDLSWDSLTYFFLAADKAHLAINALQDHLKLRPAVLKFGNQVLTPDDYLFDIGYTPDDVIEVTTTGGQPAAGKPMPGFQATAEELARTVADVMTGHEIEPGSDLFCAGRVLPPGLTLRDCGVIAGDTLRARNPKPPKFTGSQQDAFWETMTSRKFEVACPTGTELVKYHDTLSIADTKRIVADRVKPSIKGMSLIFKPGNSDERIVPLDTELVKKYLTWNAFQPSGSFVAVFFDDNKDLGKVAEESIVEVTGKAVDRATRTLWLACEESRAVFERTWRARPRPK